jgi:hypothetical protein
MNSQQTTANVSTSIVQPSKANDIELNEKILFKLAVQVMGIKKRCRTYDRHSFQLGHIPYNDGQFDKSEVSDKVKAFIQTNMKQVDSLVRVYLDHVVIKNEGHFTSTQWEPFSAKNVRFDLDIVNYPYEEIILSSKK